MQNVFEENLNFIKIICSAALIYLACKALGSLILMKRFISPIISLLKSEKYKSRTGDKEQEVLHVEIKNKKNILFKMPRENSKVIQEISINSYNYTPIINKFSIFTYNILCQKFMMRRDRRDLSLENRMERIKEQILSLDPDIICLQECVFHSIKLHLESFLSSNYEIYYMENYGSNFYNLTAFKKDKFELRENKKINLDDIKVEGNRGIYCLELKIKNKFNSLPNPVISTNLNTINNLESKKDDKNKTESKVILNQEEKAKISSNEKEVENSKIDENLSNPNNFVHQPKSSKSNKNKSQNFFYNYRNFIEYNKAENKNKLVIYNVHFPWKPVFDFEKCLILNRIADDIINKNQRNYIIIGDFNSKPNSLLMRMIYLENFINEIKYYKNIINFKSEYFKKKNNEISNKNDKNIGFYDYDGSSNQKTKTKYNYINTEKIENLVEESNRKTKRKIEEDQNVNELISNFDILKELKKLQNNSTEKKLDPQIKEKNLILANKESDSPSTKTEILPENNDNFWTKLSEQKHQENVCNKKIKEFDILKEIFYLNVKLEKERHNFSLDSKDKIFIKEILKLLTLSDNKKTFQDFFSNQSYDNINNNYLNDHHYQINNVQTYNTCNHTPNPKYLIDKTNRSLYNQMNNNYINSNPDLHYHHDSNLNGYPNQNNHYKSFNYEANYNQNSIENKHYSMSLGITISNDNYIKIRNMIDNFKNLYIKYKFRSAYDSYQIEHNKNLEILNILANENLENISDKKLVEVITIKKKIEVDSKIIKDEIISETTTEKVEVENNKDSKNSSHISDYLRNHPLYTNFTDNFKDTIDYIFYSKYLIVDKILKLPDYDELISEGFLPSSKYPSDHLPLYAEFSTN